MVHMEEKEHLIFNEGSVFTQALVSSLDVSERIKNVSSWILELYALSNVC